jgi:hypothetical protein
MRPTAIVAFERLFVLSLLVGVVQCIVGWEQAVAVVGSALAVLLIEIIIAGLTLLLIWLTSRRRKKIAKWILIIMFAIGLPQFVELLAENPASPFVILSFIQVILEIAALALLFTAAARIWLGGRPDGGAAAPPSRRPS